MKYSLIVAGMIIACSQVNAQQFTIISESVISNEGLRSAHASWGDPDGDGFPDLFVPNREENNNFFYINLKDGNFRKETASVITLDGANSSGASWGDFDNDGDPDLFVTNLSGENNLLYRNDGFDPSLGTIRFTQITTGAIVNDGGFSVSSNWIDYDGDGDLDLYVVNKIDAQSFLYENFGPDGFSRIFDGPLLDNRDGWKNWAAWGDYDNDGDLDVYFALETVSGTSPNGVRNLFYENLGNGNFQKIENSVVTDAVLHSETCAWADYDNDGDLDLYVGNWEQNNLYINQGDGSFVSLSEGSAVTDEGITLGCNWIDYDNDGDLDLLVYNASVLEENQFNAVYENLGNGELVAVTTVISSVEITRSGAPADYDRDGDIDLFLSTTNNENKLIRNNNENNHWINILLRGTVSNIDAIGARVSVLATINNQQNWQVREITGQTGREQTTLNAAFGLGDATIIDSVRIRWPSGAIQELANIDVDQFMTITEPSAVRVIRNPIAQHDSRSSGVAWGDLNNDNLPDLFVTTGLGQANRLYHNLGNGEFEQMSEGEIANDVDNSVSATWGDYNNDGWEDIFVSNGSGQNNFLYRNNGDLTFTKIAEGALVNDDGESKSCSWADFNNDGNLDLFVANDYGVNFLYKNNGDGTFQRELEALPAQDIGNSFGVNWIDIDTDGDLDLFVANFGANFFYENHGGGRFDRLAATQILNHNRTHGASWADFDNDGDFDVMISGFRDIALYQNLGRNSETGSLNFTRAVSQNLPQCRSNSYADVDNDGLLDVIVTRNGNNFFWENGGEFDFFIRTIGAIVNDGGNSNGSAWADYDQDGFSDLVVGNFDGNDFLYRTNGTPGSGALRLRLKGRASNTSGIGARLTAIADFDGERVRQQQHVSAQQGFASQNSPIVQFGVKDANSVDSLTVHWPSGARNVYLNLPVSKLKIIEENNRPAPQDTLPIIQLGNEAETFTRDLLSSPAIYRDADGDSMRFTAVADDASIISVTVEGSRLRVTLLDNAAPGIAALTLSADDDRIEDGRGDSERLRVQVNRHPTLIGDIPTVTFLPGQTLPVTIDLNAAIRNQDVGESLDYTISNPRPEVAAVVRDDRILTITPGDSPGVMTVTIEVDDQRGGMVETSFTIRKIESNQLPEIIGTVPEIRQLVIGDEPMRLPLLSVFQDPDGDPLSFTTTSTPPAVALAAVVEDTLVVTPLNLGEAAISVRANDGLGGEASIAFNVEVLRSFRPVVSHIPASSPAVPGQAINISATVSDEQNDVLTSYLHYRIAGNAAFDSMAMQLTPDGADGFTATAEIPANVITDRGLVYFIAATDQHEVSALQERHAIRVRSDGEGIRAGTPQPAGSAQRSYRLISLPSEVDQSDPADVLADDLGSYDPARWRLYQWSRLPDGSTGKVEYDPATGGFAMNPGTAFWLIVKSANRFIDTGAGTSVAGVEPFSVPVADGWNLIGNPFNFRHCSRIPLQMAAAILSSPSRKMAGVMHSRLTLPSFSHLVALRLRQVQTQGHSFAPTRFQASLICRKMLSSHFQN